jgi:hypothetical protein
MIKHLKGLMILTNKQKQYYFTDDIFKNILSYSLEGSRVLLDVEVRCLGCSLDDRTLTFHIVNKEKVDCFKGYMINVLRKYGINICGERIPLIKYPYFNIHYEDIRAEIPQLKEYITYATIEEEEEEELNDHEWSDFDEYFFTSRFICDIQLSLTHTPIITKWFKK